MADNAFEDLRAAEQNAYKNWTIAQAAVRAKNGAPEPERHAALAAAHAAYKKWTNTMTAWRSALAQAEPIQGGRRIKYTKKRATHKKRTRRIRRKHSRRN